MFRKILTISGFAAIAAAFGFNNTDISNEEVAVSDLILSNTEALADCQNGCVENGNGCYCNGWYPCYKEYSGS